MASITAALAGDTVDLLGEAYETVPRTRSVTIAATKLAEESGSILDDENADPDLQVEYLAKVLALRLKPKTDTAPSADQRLLDLWQQDLLSLDQLFKLIEDLSGSAEGN